MPTPTYTPLSTITLTGSDSLVSFANIPSTFRDLVLVSYLSSLPSMGGYFGVQFNNDTGNNYSEAFMWGTGGAAQSAARSGINGNYLFWDYSKSGAFSILQILDYSASDKHKVSMGRADSPDWPQTTGGTFRWANTAPITSIQLSLTPRQFEAGCTFSLFGIGA